MPTWKNDEALLAEVLRERTRPVRLLALISQHGALDLEVPELLGMLFPDLEIQHVLHGSKVEQICNHIEGSTTLDRLCAKRGDSSHENQSRPHEGQAQQATAVAREWSLDANDPRLRFVDEGGVASLLPELVATSGWLEAIWARRVFPSTPVVLFFGPPLLLTVAEDILNEQTATVSRFWDNIETLLACAGGGRCLIAAESLFRSERNIQA